MPDQSLRSLAFGCLSAAALGLSAQSGTWTWMKGSSAPDDPGDFGVQGVPSPTNNPPALYQAAEWTDLNGNFWIWSGLHSIGGEFNTHQALWRYEPATGMWTWMKGPSDMSYGFIPGNYGTQGVPAESNYPPARSFGVSTWVGQDGALWMYGGSINDPSTFQMLYFGDLWRYDIGTNMWTWVKGPSTPNPPGVQGTLNVEAATNLPRVRREGVATWTADDGNLWMFGGLHEVEFLGELADLWKYDIATNNWVWMGGQAGANISSIHGTLGLPSPNNRPGSRAPYAHWKDDCGNFWLFGGWQQNDLWKYEVATGRWAWMAGPQNESNATLTVGCNWTSHFPAKRIETRSVWKDHAGRFWSYGGQSNPNGQQTNMWVFDPAQGKFMGVRGYDPLDFGIMGVPAPSNSPPAHLGGADPFVGSDGSLWLFGGLSNDGMMNALWRYTIDPACPGIVEQQAYTLSGDTSGCGPFHYTPTVQGIGSDQHLAWDFGVVGSSSDTSSALAPAYDYTVPGTYTVTLHVGSGADCHRADELTAQVVVLPTPQAGFTATPQPASASNTTIQFTDTSQSNIVAWYWDLDNVPPLTSDQPDPLVTFPHVPGSYPVMLVVRNAEGCTDTLRSVIIVREDSQLELPNVFSPNGDGSNDRFVPLDGFYGSGTLHIFDRWGLEVFTTDVVASGWDGRVNGTPAPEGTYFWTLDGIDHATTSPVHSGHLTLLR